MLTDDTRDTTVHKTKIGSVLRRKENRGHSEEALQKSSLLI